MPISRITDPVAGKNRVSGSQPPLTSVKADPRRAPHGHIPRVQDPDIIIRSRRRGGNLAALMTAAIGIFVFAVAFGYLPQVGLFWNQFNDNLQSHNDEVVQWIMSAYPTAALAVLGFAVLFILYRILRWIASSRDAD